MNRVSRACLSAVLALALNAAAGCDDTAAPNADRTAPAAASSPAHLEPSMPEPPMMPDPGAAAPDTCNAELAKPAALGKIATPDIVEQARRDAGATTVRVLAPGQMVTMEFLAGRLNIDVDDANTIVNLRCG